MRTVSYETTELNSKLLLSMARPIVCLKFLDVQDFLAKAISEYLLGSPKANVKATIFLV